MRVRSKYCLAAHDNQVVIIVSATYQAVTRSPKTMSPAYLFAAALIAGVYIRSVYSFTIRRALKTGADVRIASLTRCVQRRGMPSLSRSK